ncbi:hypothetical protein MACH05_13520 [Qipengyuania nanhaisediminis]
MLLNTIPRPDCSARPLRWEGDAIIHAPVSAVFAAWTTRLDTWFAQPGTLSFDPEPGRPFFFYNRTDWGRHPHYGRVLACEQDRMIEMTWVTGDGTDLGTCGAETIVRITLEPRGDATAIYLAHEGFVSMASRNAHGENWPIALQLLDEALA